MPDEIKLTTRIKHALRALYHTRASLPADEPADSKTLVDVNTRIEDLRSKLQKIVGTPDVLTAFDEELRASGALTQCGESGYCHLSNQQLAHELFLDPTFRFDEVGFSKHQQATANTGHRQAFYAVSEASLSITYV